MLSLPSSSSSSSSISRQKYDVFLSFRGEDTRKKFTDHLYAAFKRNEIVTFRDDPKLEAGEEIAPELFKAIQESWCSVIVFSETYAFSSWCLEELAEIVEQRNKRGHKIFPIFYDVDPSDLRKQRERVDEAFAKHEEKYKDDKDKIQRWRTALTEVANIKGWHLSNRHEAEFIGDIVKKISAKLCQTYTVVRDDLIGIDSRLQELHSKIDIGEDDVRITGICGMGGIGKTTLARVVYDQMLHHFEGKSFLYDVRENSKKSGLVSLQKQLLSQILLEEDFNLFNVDDGKSMIRHRLSHKKVLIVIDDADNFQHLKCLVGRRDWFGAGSRIIITTRDEHLLRSYKVDDVYKPTTLNEEESLQLFNSKAFDSDIMPENDFVELAQHVVEYAGGLPLALEVLGCFFCRRDEAEWRSAIERLKSEFNKDIHGVLQISFDGLEETEKKIFLDIACFFNGEEKDFVIKVLDGCGFYPVIGIRVLFEKSLLKVDESDKYLRMHDLLQEMGRKIVREKCLDEPGKRCRLWEKNDVNHVLTRDTATETIEGMVIDNKEYKSTAGKVVEGMTLDDIREQDKTLTLSADAFLKMKRLRLLRLFSDQQKSHDHLKYLSNDLRLLDWSGYPFRSLSSSFQPSNLVALLIPDSHIERLWEENSPLPKLKLVDLRGSKDLIETPDFTRAPDLESLILEGCISMEEVHLGVLSKLKLLNLRGCKNLRRFPTKIEMESLETLILSGCSNLRRFPEIVGEMKKLLELYLDGTRIKELPSSISRLSGLKLLNLRGCSNLQRFPEIVGEMKCLKKLYLDGTCIKELPSSISRLSGLELLNLRDCKSLTSLPSKIVEMESLETLILSGCSNLQRFPEIVGEMKCLKKLYLDGTRIKELPSSISLFSNLGLLNLKDCSDIVSLPSSIDGCKFLHTLILSGCSKVETLPENLLQAEFLGELDLSGTAIRKSLVLHSLSALSSLYKLNLSDCNLEEGDISSDIGCLSSLEQLYLSGNNFSSLPATLGELPKLYLLDLVNCRNLKSLPKIRFRTRYVHVDGCASLVEDPIIVCCDWGGVTIRGVNCYKLVEKNNALTMLRKQIKVLRNETRQIQILVPGSEIPEWFSHQTDGSSMNIALPPNIDNDSRWVGIAFCCLVVYAFNGEDDDDDGHAFWNDVESYGRFNQGSFFYLDNKRQRVKKDHLWIHYISRDCWEKKDWKGNNGYSQIIEYRTGARLYYKVKKCAVQIVYEEDLGEMEQIKEQCSSPASEIFDDRNGGARVKRRRKF